MFTDPESLLKRCPFALAISLSSFSLLMTAPPARADAIEEVIVTAQKRAQNLQEASVSVTALTTKDIEQIGAADMYDYVRQAPGMNIYSEQPGEGKITIRGVGDGINTGNLGPTTGYYLDESPVTLVDTNPDLKLFDVERVEVLRGPQGTLYGVASMGGTIRVITNKPDASKVAGKLELTTADTHKGDASYSASGMLNLPLVADKLAVRAVGYYRDEGGFIDAPRLGVDDVNDEQTWGGRVAMRFTPNDQFAVTGTITHQDTDLGGRFYSTPTQPDPLVSLNIAPEPGGDVFTSYNLTAEVDFGWGTLTSASSYFDRTQRNTLDFSALSFVFPFVPDGNRVPFVTKRDIHTFAQEIRLASNFDGPVQFLIGGFYQDTHEVPFQYAPAQDGDANIIAFFGGSPPPGLLLGPRFGIPDAIVLFLNDEKIRNKALFGEIYWNFAEKWTATFGVRAFDDNDTIVSQSFGIAGTGASSVGRSSSRDENLKFKLEYQMSDHALFYAQAAQGFRGGGQNGPLIGPPSRPADEYESDTLWNYELAAKTTWLDDKVLANVALYYTDWSDMQVQVPFPPLGSFIANAGKAEIRGFEGEFIYSPLRGLDLMSTVAWTDAKFAETVNPGAGVIDGVRLPGVPKLTFAGAIQYAHQLTGALDGYVRLDYQQVGASYSSSIASATSDSRNRIGDFDLVDFRAGIQHDRWEGVLYVRNLTDERARLATNLGFPRSDVQRNRPRSIGLTLRYSF